MLYFSDKQFFFIKPKQVDVIIHLSGGHSPDILSCVEHN